MLKGNRRSMLVFATVLAAALSVLSFTGKTGAQGGTSAKVYQPNATCATNVACNTMPQRLDCPSCPFIAPGIGHENCDFTTAGGSITYCGQSTGSCLLVNPDTPNDCTGHCAITVAISCKTVVYNKCVP